MKYWKFKHYRTFCKTDLPDLWYIISFQFLCCRKIHKHMNVDHNVGFKHNIHSNLACISCVCMYNPILLILLYSTYLFILFVFQRLLVYHRFHIHYKYNDHYRVHLLLNKHSISFYSPQDRYNELLMDLNVIISLILVSKEKYSVLL